MAIFSRLSHRPITCLSRGCIFITAAIFLVSGLLAFLFSNPSPEVSTPKPTSGPLVRKPFVKANFTEKFIKVSSVENLSQYVDSGALTPFLLKEQIGQGGMGRVYLAEDSESGQLVAVKTFFLYEPHFVDHLLDEISALNALPPHPNIMGVKEILVDEEAGVEIMDFLPGKDAHSILNEYFFEGPCQPREGVSPAMIEAFARSVVSEVLVGLKHMHAHDVVHGDIKSLNVMLGKDMTQAWSQRISSNETDEPLVELKLIDFSISRLQPDHCALEVMVSGTYFFDPPEAIEGIPVNPYATDLWSSAALLVEILLGDMPWLMEPIEDDVFEKLVPLILKGQRAIVALGNKNATMESVTEAYLGEYFSEEEGKDTHATAVDRVNLRSATDTILSHPKDIFEEKCIPLALQFSTEVRSLLAQMMAIRMEDRPVDVESVLDKDWFTAHWEHAEELQGENEEDAQIMMTTS